MKKLSKTHQFSFEKATLGLAKEGFSVACVYKTIRQKYKDPILQKSIPDVGIFIRGGCCLLPRFQFGPKNFHCPYTLEVHLLRSYSPTCKVIRLLDILPMVAGNFIKMYGTAFYAKHGQVPVSNYTDTVCSRFTADYADCDSPISRECPHYWFNFFCLVFRVRSFCC